MTRPDERVGRVRAGLDAVVTDISERWPARVAPTHLDEVAADAGDAA